MSTSLIDAIFQPYLDGQPAVLLSQRSLFDLMVDDGKIRPVIDVLRREGQERHGLACITYSLATGLEWQAPSRDQKDSDTVRTALKSHGLLDIPQDQNEVVRVIRGIASMSRTAPTGVRWASGEEMRFAFLLLFGEHLTPGQLQNGTQSDAQLIASELAHVTAQSLALRASSNYIMFHADEGLVDGLVCGALHHVRLAQPDQQEKLQFLSAASAIYTKVERDGLSDEAVARLTANTPNRGLEAILRSAHRSGRPLTARALVERKSKDVEQLSEGSLSLLDTHLVHVPELVGSNMATVRRVFNTLAKGLASASPHMPANVLLAGPPGTGKTLLTQLLAREAQASAYLMNSPKGPYVGQTERLARQQQVLLGQWTPNVALCDEITEAFPLERSDFDGDSGASRAVMAQLLTSLADESRRGRSLLVATTNCPWRIGAAMRSRFTVIPVLHPLPEDYPALIAAVCRQADPTAEVDPADDKVKEAARIYWRQGANPRHIRSSVSTTLMLRGHMDADGVLAAALDFCGSTDMPSAIYADYWALKCCSSKSFLPWAGNPQAYPFPDHLKEVVDPESGTILHDSLEARIADLKPHANL